MENKLVIFDLDGTLAEPESGQTFRHTGEPYVWRDQCQEMLLALHQDGVRIAIATNQGGIAAGHVTSAETEQAIHALLSTLPFSVPVLVCPYVGTYKDSPLWRASAPWRKPSPVMLLMLAALYPHIDHEAILTVGDRQEDEYAARNAGFAFQYIGTFMRQWRGDVDEDFPF